MPEYSPYDALVQLQDSRDRAVEEAAIVRDDQERLAALRDEPLQPGEHPHIEIVGRLVQQVEVGAAQQEAGEHQACEFTATQAGDRALVLDVS